MSNRNDIIDGNMYQTNKGLIYTKKCGWIDLGHANPNGPLGVIALLKKMNIENSRTPNNKYYEIIYEQRMARWGIRSGRQRKYIVKGGLKENEIQSVALSMLFDVSNDFEKLQGNWLFSLVTDSGYSAEDLVSNLIGFYKAVEPTRDHIFMCEPVSKEKALYVWDKYGAVGMNKNLGFGPYLYPTEPNSREPFGCARMPWFLDTIKPAAKGEFFKETDKGFTLGIKGW